MPRPRLQILYIGGSGRSGSTLLARILGELPGFINIGELALSLLDRDIQAFEIPCGCGQPESECPFWRGIHPGGHIRDLGRPLQIFRLNQLSGRLERDPALQAALSRLLADLYARIAAAADAEWIVDSSKNPIAGGILSQLPDTRFALLHVIRDSRGVVSSWRHGKQYLPRLPLFRMAREWNQANRGIERLAGQADSNWRWRWEDFLAAPEAYLKHLLRDLERPQSSLDFIQGGAVRLHPQHVLFGNPGKLERGEIPLVPPALPPASVARALVTSLTWPMLWRYGYLGRRNPASLSQKPFGHNAG